MERGYKKRDGKKEGEMSDKRGAIILSSGWLHFYNFVEPVLGCVYMT